MKLKTISENRKPSALDIVYVWVRNIAEEYSSITSELHNYEITIKAPKTPHQLDYKRHNFGENSRSIIVVGYGMYGHEGVYVSLVFSGLTIDIDLNNPEQLKSDEEAIRNYMGQLIEKEIIVGKS